MNFKEEIAKFVGVSADLITPSPKAEMGDFCLPCFAFAKEQKKSPFLVATELKAKLEPSLPAFLEKMEVIAGYLNFFLDKEFAAKNILESCHKEFEHKDLGKGKRLCIDYCSPNLAKYMHIGHFSNLVTGESLQRIYAYLGYDITKICYVGDYGTPFGKMVVAIKKWGDLETVKQKGIDEIQNLYIEFAKREVEDESLIEEARKASKMIEDKEGEPYEIYKLITGIAIEECKRIVALMNVTFDDWRGESFYSDSMAGVLNELEEKKISEIGEGGATIVDLEEYGAHIAVVKRADGGSVYITRDLTAAEDRYNLYKFDKMLYVVGLEQSNHFKQLFKILELMGKPYAKNMQHISYGLFSMKEGKISSRKGKQALFAELFAEGVEAAQEVVKDKEFAIEDKGEFVKKVARSALAFSVLKVERNKDKIFDKEKMISFDGETAPYIQYTYARCCSLERKFEEFAKKHNLNTETQGDTTAASENFALIKTLYAANQSVLDAYEKHEPCFIARALIDICQEFNKFYHNTKILDDSNPGCATELMQIVLAVKKRLKSLMPLVLIDVVEEM